jgi:hypothetical protein
MALYYIAASHLTLHASVCPMWHIFKFFTEINKGFGNKTYYKHFPPMHFQNANIETAQLLHEGEYKFCTVTKVRMY